MPSFRLLVSLLFLSSISVIAVGCVNSDPGAKPPAAEIPGEVVHVSGSGSALPLVQHLAEVYGRSQPKSRFEFETGTNSGGAIKGVIDGSLDLAVSNRSLTEAESREPVESFAFARDATVFAVHLPNPILSLSTDQIKDVFGGKIVNWKQLGGEDLPMVVLDRDVEESSRKQMLLPLLNGSPVKARTVVLTTAEDMVKSIKDTPGAIGYSSLGLLRLSGMTNMQVLSLDGVEPNRTTIASGAYPWVSTFSLVTRRDSSSEIRAFLDFVTGSTGRTTLEVEDFVPASR